MSAWLVFSMMGFYPVCPASGEYIMTTPAFEEIRIQLPGGKYFISKSEGLGKESFYIKSATKNGREFKGSYITHKEIMEGSEFLFRLSDFRSGKLQTRAAKPPQ
jgi:putative alpha-1,2-mannosidase